MIHRTRGDAAAGAGDDGAAHDQGQLFYSFCLDDVVPSDHRVREIAGVLNLSWAHGGLASYYSNLGRPSIIHDLDAYPGAPPFMRL